MPPFANRRAAGRALAHQLSACVTSDALVLALPRGGVPVAAEVAAALGAELDVLVVRKLGVPGHSELAMGAIGPGGVRVMNDAVVATYAIDESTIAAVARRELAELERRERVYRNERPAPHIAGRDVILVDDGLATGATMRAAIAAVKRQQPARILVAVPVAAADTAAAIRTEIDALICVQQPRDFFGVGQFYDDFRQTTDEEVIALLQRT